MQHNASWTLVALAVIMVTVMVAPTGGWSTPAQVAPQRPHGNQQLSVLLGGTEAGGDQSRGLVPASRTLPYVNSTLVLWNNSLEPGNFIADTAGAPYMTGMAYDSGKDELYVADDEQPGYVSLYSASGRVGVTQIGGLGFNPTSVAYDSLRGQIFVLSSYNSTTGTVIISDTSNQVVGTVPGACGAVGNDFEALSYDPIDGEIFELCGSVVRTISDSTDRAVSNFTLVSDPYYGCLVYDSGVGEIFVSNYGGNNVSVINASTDKLVTYIGAGSGPAGLAYDPAKGEVFVADSLSNSVTVISDKTNSVVATVPTRGAIGMTYDNGTGEIFAASGNYVSVISDASDKVIQNLTVGQASTAEVYDYRDSIVYVVCSEALTGIWASNDTTFTVWSAGDNPTQMAYDGRDGRVFVVDRASTTLGVVSTITNHLTNILQPGVASTALTYDPVQYQLYDGGNDQVAYFNASTLVKTAPFIVLQSDVGGGSPLAYDRGRGEVFIADGNKVTIVNATTEAITANVGVGSVAYSIVYDPAQNEVFVANEGSENVSVISDTTDKVVANIDVGTEPYGLAFDAKDGEVFVANWASSNLSVISVASNTVVASIPLPNQPSAVVYDPNNTEVLAMGGSPVVSVISTMTNTVIDTLTVGGAPSLSGPSAGLYDPANGDVYLTDLSMGTVSILSFLNYSDATFDEQGLPAGSTWSVDLNGTVQRATGSTLSFQLTNGSYNYTIGPVQGYTPSPSSGGIRILGRDVNTSITFSPPTYRATFMESGLPGGTAWTVILNGTKNASTSATVGFAEVNGTYNYTVAGPAGYMASPATGSLIVAGKAVVQNITFSRLSGPARYAVTITESGLPSGTSWSVTFNGTPGSSSTSGITFSNLLNNTTGYVFTVGGVSGYTASPSSGSVVVSGANVTRAIAFTKSTGPTQYIVTFSESGLVASGVPWSVTMNSTTKSNTTARSGTGSITFTEANGTYSFSVGAIAGYSVSPSSGSVRVSGDADSQSVTFTALPVGQYSVIFSETGLPTGTNWSVTLAGKSASSIASTISFTEKNGTYNYTVAAPTGYAASPSSGSLTVAGQSVGQGVTFSKSSSKATYEVTFAENGLPSGISWWVTLNGRTPTSVTATITFQETNGSYSYSVGVLNGYTASPSSGSLNVSGHTVNRTITFTVTAPSKGSNGSNNQTTAFLGLPGDDGYFLIGAIVAIVAAVMAVMLIRRRRGAQQAPPPVTVQPGGVQQPQPDGPVGPPPPPSGL